MKMQTCVYTFLSMISFQMMIADECAHWGIYNINVTHTNTFGVKGDEWSVFDSNYNLLNYGKLSDIPIVNSLGWTSVDHVIGLNPVSDSQGTVQLWKGNEYAIFNPDIPANDLSAINGSQQLYFDSYDTVTAVSYGSHVLFRDTLFIMSVGHQVFQSLATWNQTTMTIVSTGHKNGTISDWPAISERGWTSIDDLSAATYNGQVYIIASKSKANKDVYEYVKMDLNGTAHTCQGCSGTCDMKICDVSSPTA